MIRAVLFDHDGVLVNFPQVMWKERKKYLEEKYDLRLNNEDMKVLLGLTLQDQVDYLRKKHNIGVTVDELSQHREKVVDPIYEKELTLMPGAKKLLEDLKSKGIKTAVATNRSRKRIEQDLARLKINNYFNVVIAREDVMKPKPDPEIFLIAAKKLDVPPNECVVIEDAIHGVEAAKKAGMIAIGVCSPIHSTFEKADLSVHSLEELDSKRILELA